MPSSRARSLRSVLGTTMLVGFAAALLGCASAGAVTDLKSVAGTWKGVAYWRTSEPDFVELTIREDGSYDFLSRQKRGESRSSGKIEIKDGRLILQGPRGRGAGTVMADGAGERVMNIDATMSDNSALTVKVWPSP